MSARDEEDGLLDSNDDDDDDDDDEPVSRKKKKNKGDKGGPKKKRKTIGGFIDDSAELSGEEDDDEEEEEEEDDNNDYIRDGFVVDDEDEGRRRRKKKKKKKKKRESSGALEDSDDDDDGGDGSDDDSDDDDVQSSKRKRLVNMKKSDRVGRLTEDDLDLIQENVGGPPRHRKDGFSRGDDDVEDDIIAPAPAAKQRVVAKTAEELQKGLFYDSGAEEDDDIGGAGGAPHGKPKPPHPSKGRGGDRDADRYDEDGMDDFIDDDIGDQGAIMAGDLREDGGGGMNNEISEAQMHEASEIFGTDYLDFLGQTGGAAGDNAAEDDEDDDDEDDLMGRGRKNRFRERGVGVDLGVDSDDEILSDDDDDDDDDLFDEDDDDDLDEMGAEALKLKREKRKLARAEKKRQALQRKADKRKAQLRRAFEPVQLVEHFCTDRDDAIRSTDAPERFFDWNQQQSQSAAMSLDERKEEAIWLKSRIPEIRMAADNDEEAAAGGGSNTENMEDSIVQALQLMHSEKLEPAFIQQYRKDQVRHGTVREFLYTIQDEDLEWTRLNQAKKKVESMLRTMLAAKQKQQQRAGGGSSSNGSSNSSGDAAQQVQEAQDALEEAQEKLQDTAQQESQIKTDLEKLTKKKVKADPDDDDDELFGDDDDEEEEDKKVKKEEEEEEDEETKKERERLTQHLETIQSLMEARAEKVTQLSNRVQVARSAATQSDTHAATAAVLQRCASKQCASRLWNGTDLQRYLNADADDPRHVVDVHAYLTLVQEGNEAVLQKEGWEQPDDDEDDADGDGNNDKGGGGDGGGDKTKDGGAAASKKKKEAAAAKKKQQKKKRSRRYQRDYYRTAVSEGLRAVCYQFLLAPNRVGLKLQDWHATGGFDFSKSMPVEKNVTTNGANDGNDDNNNENSVGNPLDWVAPVITANPQTFANDLIGSGELVLLSSTAGNEKSAAEEANDPLKGCRYVAAMELAQEPRVRRVLRAVYRRACLLTTRPTARGLQEMDAFHDYYGYHLIHDKPVGEHFYLSAEDRAARRATLHTAAERNELDQECDKLRKQSCLQYLNVLKAEQSGFVATAVHLPLLEVPGDWYHPKRAEQIFGRTNQDLTPLMRELERVYFPPDGDDTEEWNEERRKVLKQALVQFLLPQLESEVRRDLREAAMQAGVIAAGESLRATAMTGPYRPAALVHSENRFLYPTAGTLPMIGVCVAQAGSKDATYIVSVSETGQVADHVAIPDGTRMEVGKMREKVIRFLIQTRPAAVLVGTSGGMGSRMMARRMGDLINVAVDRWSRRDIQGDDEDDEAFESRRLAMRQLARAGGGGGGVGGDPYDAHPDDEDEEGEWKCNVELVDDGIAQLFGRSVRGKKEFPEYEVNLKCAISVARTAQDPLAELTYAWSVASDAGVFGTETLVLNVHPLQRMLPKNLLLRQYERILCNVVAAVGTDVNAACSQDHLRGLLMFVPGLGPRKAAHLKQNVTQLGGTLSRRRELLEKKLLGPVVYNNAVAFLRIQEADQLVDQFLHPLDNTRLHPDVYLVHNWAVKIAFDALEREDGKSKDAAAIKALRDVMDNSSAEVERLFEATKAEWEQHYGPTFNVKDWDPRTSVPADMWRDKVEELDLEAFANMIEENGHGRWHSHLEMIKWEFRLPFADPRKPMEPLAGDQLFTLITGESDQSLRPGKEVTGKVIRNGDFGSRVSLEGNITAFIGLRNLSDEHVETAEDVVTAGQVVTAVILEVKKDHMSVDMSLKMDDFRKSPASWPRPDSLPPLDDHFDRAAAARIQDEAVRRRELHIEALQASLGRGTGDSNQDGAGRKKTSGPVFARRACTHPAFRNGKNGEVMAELKEGGAAVVGEALIRPSSKSSDSLAVHWVVKEGSIKVIEVFEDEKETDVSIGSKLRVKNETYGTIDELLGRFIAPMNDYVEELINHRKFMDLPEDEVDTKLLQMKKAQPKSIPYALCWMEMHPGYASLRFVSSSTPRQHPVGLAPDGFTWGNSTYSTLDRLINEFKKNPRGTKASSNKSPLSPARTNSNSPPRPPPPPAAPSSWGASAPPPAPPPPQHNRPPPPAAWRPPPPPAAPPTRPPPPRPPVPPAAAATTGAGATWNGGQQQQPPAPPAGWGHRPPPPATPNHRPPPPSNLPPPPQGHNRPPPPPPQATNLPPPPTMQQRPPAPPPVPQQQQTPGFGRGQQPPQMAAGGFAGGGAAPGQGRGRGRTLPAWMSKT